MEKHVVLNAQRDVTLSFYPATRKTKLFFLICPGGSYRTCEESESAPVAKRLNRLGYNAAVFRYSVGEHYRWLRPLEDLDQAMDYLCSHAEEYALDPDRIVVMGFSAGGHVAASAASLARRRPFAAVLCYGLTARETLDFCAPDAPDASTLVNDDTCPCFLATGRNDWIVPAFNTTRMLDAFQAHFIDYEAHIYGYAMHGFSFGRKASVFCSRVGGWLKDCLAWLEELETGHYVSVRENADWQDAHSESLSTMVSCKVLEEHPEALAALRKRFPAQILLYTAAKKKIGSFMDTVSLRNLFELLRMSRKTLRKMDELLSAYPIRR